jgi:hypothetical protein
MNAIELAEIQAFKTEELTMWERNHTATMLRQQQAEIDRLLTIAEDFQMLIMKQKDEIEALKILVDELAGYKASYENGIRMEDGYGLN